MPIDYQQHPIETRRLQFNVPKDLPRYWNDNCAVKTHIFNAIAILAPAFERLAISSVMPFRDKIEQPLLKAQLEGFIGQESAHGSEFIRYNRVLKAQGYDTQRLEKNNLRKFKWLASKFSATMHLSLTLAAEHLTSIISDRILRDPKLLERAAPSCAALWRWHAIEEIEHKAVVFDVYQSLAGGYFTRVFGMLMVTSMLGGLLFQNFLHLIWHDKLLFKASFWGRWCSVCWGKMGFLRKLILPYLRYYLPGFHPWQQNNQALIAHWKTLFADIKTPTSLVQILIESPYKEIKDGI